MHIGDLFSYGNEKLEDAGVLLITAL